ncbi:MAG: hypothetical protein CSA21_04975 [Deltaproteobacteria bacterium]|nr:MAG: hypothetical protein CSA21_04975 [Deltaproteobacteria bacterium]
MITINLLPQKRRARISHMYLELLGAGMFFVVLIVGMGVGYYFLHSHIQHVQATRDQRQNARQIVLVKVGKVTKLTKELEALDVKIAAIRKIRMRQGLPVRYVDEVVSRIPPGKIWLEAFSLHNNARMDIKGVALDNQAFALYVDQLRESSFVANVMTRQTQQQSIHERELVAFQCSILARPPASQENGHE